MKKITHNETKSATKAKPAIEPANPRDVETPLREAWVALVTRARSDAAQAAALDMHARSYAKASDETIERAAETARYFAAKVSDETIERAGALISLAAKAVLFGNPLTLQELEDVAPRCWRLSGVRDRKLDIIRSAAEWALGEARRSPRPLPDELIAQAWRSLWHVDPAFDNVTAAIFRTELELLGKKTGKPGQPPRTSRALAAGICVAVEALGYGPNDRPEALEEFRRPSRKK